MLGHVNITNTLHKIGCQSGQYKMYLLKVLL